MLPSGYVQATAISLNFSHYINTGVIPSSTLGIDALFDSIPNGGYVFGSRNSNSNTSAGQINLYTAQNAASYFGYRSARISLTNNLMDLVGMLHVHTDSYEIEVVNANAYVVSVTGSESSFTGTQPMYIGCMNNAGSPTSNGACSLLGFKVYDNGILVNDFVPCVDSSNKQGAYDAVNNNFIAITGGNLPASTLYLLSIEATVGGTAYCHTAHGEKLKQVYAGTRAYRSGYTVARLEAVPEAGYVFLNWTDSNSNVVSTERNFEYSVSQAETLTANFIKETDYNAHHSFMAMGIKYGENRDASLRDDIYSEVISASITTDTMQKATSTITLKEVPSLYQSNMPIVIFNPKGKPVYYGVIQSIDGNKLTCREPMSVYDEDFLFHINTSLGNGLNLTTHSVMYGATHYMDYARNRNTDNLLGDVNVLQQRKLYPFISRYNEIMNLDESRVFSVRLPKIEEVGISNLEDYLLSLFDNFGIYVRTSLQFGRRDAFSQYDSHYFEMKPTYIRDFDTLKISDNVENVQNVNINIEEAESTVLIIYNSTGTSVRQYVGMKTDGSIATFNASTTSEELLTFIGYNRYKVKVVASDDDLATLRAQNLSNSMYNHKISFTLGLGGKLFDIESFKIGQPVDFYYEGKVYNSVVTGISFNIDENSEKIESVNITLGKVRNNLTSKLNLGKVKR